MLHEMLQADVQHVAGSWAQLAAQKSVRRSDPECWTLIHTRCRRLCCIMFSIQLYTRARNGRQPSMPAVHLRMLHQHEACGWHMHPVGKDG